MALGAVPACAALAALSLLLPWALAFDPQVWIAWGHDALHGHLDTEGGPTWKPLSVLGTTLLAPLDRDAEPVWAALGRMGGLLAPAGAYVLGERLAGRLAAPSPRWRWRSARGGCSTRRRQLRGLARRRGAGP